MMIYNSDVLIELIKLIPNRISPEDNYSRPITAEEMRDRCIKIIKENPFKVEVSNIKCVDYN